MNYYIEGKYSNGDVYFCGPYDFHNISSALEVLETSPEILVTNIIAEKD